MELYNPIFKRKSIRNYSDKELSRGKLEEIQKYLNRLEGLYEKIETEISIVRRDDKIDDAISGLIGNIGRVKAPHYIVSASEKESGYLENIGYRLEPLVLKLTDMNIGTCWLGSHFNEDELRKSLDLKDDFNIPAIIAMGFPKEENAFRENPGQAKRKELPEIISGGMENLTEEWKTILDAVRLAPSAMNKQPWRFEIFKDGAHLFIDKKGDLAQKLANRFGNLEEMNKIDAGIALSHVKIAGEYLDKEVKLESKPEEREDLEYIISIFEV